MAESGKENVEVGQSEQELIKPTKSGGGCKKLCCTLFVIATIVVIAAISFFVFNKQESAQPLSTPKSSNVSVTLGDVLTKRYSARFNSSSWLSNSELLFKDPNGNLMIFDLNTRSSSLLLGLDTPAFAYSRTQKLSPDRRYLLLGHNFKKIFRHSSVGRYSILDLVTKTTYNLTDDYLLLAKWGPVGNSLVFVRENNVYYKPTVESAAIQITNDGSNFVYNGVCDWVYEEEVFSGPSAIWFSPKGTKLAFIRFDDTGVPLIQIPVYGSPGDYAWQYPSNLTVSYPKAGATNPTVKVFAVDLNRVTQNVAAAITEIKVPTQLQDEDHIIGMVAWANEEKVLTAWMNRVQNETYVLSCNGANCKQLFEVKSTTGWVDLKQRPIFKNDGSQFVYISPHKQDNNDSYYHLTLVDTDTGKHTALTEGHFVVTEVLHWNQDNGDIYYAANLKNQPYVNHIYVLDFAESEIYAPKCLTCNINWNGIYYDVFRALISPDSKHILLSSLGPSVPRIDIFSHNLNKVNAFNHEYVWEDNQGLRTLLMNVSTPQISQLRVGLKSGFDAIVKLQLPPNADLSGKTKYATLVQVYGGPNSYLGTNEWGVNFDSYLSTNQSRIHLQINGRGSGGRGLKIMHAGYRNLGSVEIEDQIEVVKKLTELYPYIDSTRIGIWGWSYGGYATGLALAKSEVFKCGASVAPVTDWLYYDSIYTERYMGLPTFNDNRRGYRKAQLSTLSRLFANKSYLLVHGSLDDNVHYQQAMALARSLEINDIPFDQITYPDEDHSLSSVRLHLFHALDKFFKTCFN